MYGRILAKTKWIVSVLPATRLSISTNPFPVIENVRTSHIQQKHLELYDGVRAQRQRVLSVPHTKVGGAKLDVRERLTLLGDEGSEVLEIGIFAGLGMPYGDIPCGGNVVCIMEVCGEKCVVSASDWMVKGGCSFPITLKKQLRAQEIALQNQLPCIYLIDSGGAFLPLQVYTLSQPGCDKYISRFSAE
jgi:3-methylcrotonyl-CoA carboxylase beta subunit